MREPSEIEKFVIARVREFRLRKKISQEKLSLCIGVSHSFVGNVESPKQPDKYNISHLNEIAKVLECSIKDFFPEKPL